MRNRIGLGIGMPILAICILAIILLFTKLNTINIRTENIKTNIDISLLNEEEWKKLSSENEKLYQEKSLIIYDDKNENSVLTYENIKYVLETMGVEVESILQTEQKNIIELNDFDTIIISLQSTDLIDYNFSKIESYVQDGGGLLFALPLEDGISMQNYKKLLGITNDRTILKTEINSMIFTDDFLINAKGMDFDDEIISGEALDVNLDKIANIHITTNDERKVPIIWDLEYGKGFVGVCNVSILNSKTSRGLISALYGNIHRVFAYPVINSSMYCIDDFPAPIPDGYDENIYEEYGYSIKEFYKNVWWEEVKKITEKYGVKYSGFIIQTYEDITEAPFNIKNSIEDAKEYAQELLSIGGELGVHGYNHQPLAVKGFDYKDESVNYKYWRSVNDALESIKATINYASLLNKNVKITSYVAPSNMISSYMLKQMQGNIENIRVYAGVYEGIESQMIQEYEVLDNGIVYAPRLESGMNIEQDSEYVAINELSYHFVNSHFFHPDDILDSARSGDLTFKELSEKYENFINWINTQTKIRQTTVAEGGGAIQRYCLTSFEKEDLENGIKLKVNGIYDEVYYMLKTKGKTISSINGAEYSKINEDYYLLKITQEDVEINLEDK